MSIIIRFFAIIMSIIIRLFAIIMSIIIRFFAIIIKILHLSTFKTPNKKDIGLKDDIALF